MDKKQVLENKKIELNNKLELIKKKSMMFSIIRFIIFILFILSFLLGIYVLKILYIIPIILVTAFIIFAIIHNNIFKNIDTLKYKIASIDHYLFKFSDKWKEISDRGNEYLDKDIYYQSDLDIFGNASLFQYLNVSKTPYGKKYLSDSLKNIQFDDLSLRQEAVLELSNNLDLALDIEAASKFYYNQNKKCNSIVSLEELGNKIMNKVSIKPFFMVLVIVGIINLLTLTVLSLTKVIDFRFILLGLIINLIISFLLRQTMYDSLDIIFDIDLTIDSYKEFLNITNYNVDAKLLKEYYSFINKNKLAINSFKKKSSIINSRRNIIVSILGNGLFVFDYFCIRLYMGWQKKYSLDILEYIKAIGRIEELNSLAVIGRVKEDICMPTIGLNLEFEDLKHPLIPSNKVVGNSFKLDGLDIITGSNMSGKTTFMRTIGVIMILFNAGTFVNGKNFSSKYMKIFTSMRATDDICEGISTFYAEILRIKNMLEYVKTNEDMLVLIDEIFKGTNTIDRLIGAKGVIKHLSNKNVYGIIATHDNELCASVAKNYHFEEAYDNDNITFDYKIKEGIAETTNAKHLMRLAGII